MKNLKINNKYNFSKKTKISKKNKFVKAVFTLTITTSILGTVILYNADKFLDIKEPTKQEIINEEEKLQPNEEEKNEPIEQVKPTVPEKQELPVLPVTPNEEEKKEPIEPVKPIVPDKTDEPTDTKPPQEQIRKQVALTFDDGPGQYTEKLLECLNENNAKATFFVVGTNVSKRPELINQMSLEGHEIGNHTYDHINFNNSTIETINDSLNTTKNLIENAGGLTSNLVRPPYGALSEEKLQQLDYSFILWSIDTLDWKTRDKELVKKAILESIKEGEIILLHDIHQTTVDAIVELLPELTNQYDFVTISDLYNNKGIELESNKKYYKAK